MDRPFRAMGSANLLANDAEARHRVNDGQHGLHSLILLAAVHDERRKRNVMIREVGLPLLGVKAVDVSVGDEQNAVPRLVDRGEMIVLRIKDVVDELKA